MATGIRANLLAFVHLRCVEFRIIGFANPFIKVELRFEEVDMPFLVADQFFEQAHGRVITRFAAIFSRFDIKRPRIMFSGQITFQRLLRRLPDPQRIELLQVGVTFQKDDAFDQLVRVLHLFDGLFAAFLGHVPKAPVFLEAVVQPVLADCC